jgi:hypothetical protein
MFPCHEERSGIVNATPGDAFAHLDEWCTRQMVQDAQKAFPPMSAQ